MVAASIALLPIVHNSHIYFWFYWSAEIVQLALLAMAVRESFLHTLTNYLGMPMVRIGLWVSVSAALIYSVSRALVVPPVTANRVMMFILNAEITMQYLVAAISVLYLILWALIRSPGRPYEVGIIFGFAINACLSGAGYLTGSSFGMRFPLLWTWLPTVAFIAAQCAWVAILCRGYVVKELPPNLPFTNEQMIGQLDGYGLGLRQLWRIWFRQLLSIVFRQLWHRR